MKEEEKPKTLLEHILDLRNVLLNSCFYILCGMLLCFVFSSTIFEILIKPLTDSTNSKIIYTSITEPISVDLKIAFYSSLILSSPFIIKKFWWFIKPGLLLREKRVIKKYFLISSTLFVSGLVFSYYLIIPSIIKSLAQLSFAKNIVFYPKISENISFILMLLLSFGISFQLPIIMIILDKLKLIPMQKQKNIWREYITCVFIISAIITPPDILSMLFLAIPLVILYGITIAFMFIAQIHGSHPHS
jgi:sec-independent protein translocase protein TatC